MVIQIKDLTENNAINLSVLLKNNKIKNTKSCCFDFSNVSECTPSGMLLLGEIINNFRRVNSNLKIEFKVNPENKYTNFAGNMGFFEYVLADDIDFGDKADTFSSMGVCIPITKINFYNYSKSWTYSHMTPTQYLEFQAENCAKILSKDSNIQKALIFMLTEVMRNSEEHADVDEILVCGYKNKNDIEFAVLDNGKGFKSSLKTRLKKNISDEEAIKLALIPRVLANSTISNENEGLGLFATSEICGALEGSFTIVSGNTAIVSRKETRVIKEAFLKGTCVRILINSSIQLDFISKLAEILEKGRRMQIG